MRWTEEVQSAVDYGIEMTTSPLIARAESLYDVPVALGTLGYSSVFDVVRLPRERFVQRHRDVLGRDTERIYDVVVGYAQQIVSQFRQDRVTQGGDISKHGPFSRPGPDYASQFLNAKSGWNNKAPNGSPEANDGPVAYLAYIYELARREEDDGKDNLRNKLSRRRPDIGSLLVNDDAINQEIPQIQLVNEILASAIQSVRQLDKLSAVNELLATTRYPNSLPYHYPNQQIRVAESVLGIELSACLLSQNIALLQGFWMPTVPVNGPASQFDNLARLQIMASRLAPEQQNIVQEPLYGGNETKEFYQKNFGNPGLNARSFASMDVFTSRTTLTVPDAGNMLCTTAGGPAAFTVIESPNYAKPDNPSGLTTGTGSVDASQQDPRLALPKFYGAKFINKGTLPSILFGKSTQDDSFTVEGLVDEHMDRINRIARLQKWLDMPFEDIDLLVTSTIEAEQRLDSVVRTSMDDNILRMLGVFRHYQTMYNVSAKQFAAWLDVVTPFAIAPNTPFLDQIFNGSGAFDAPFVVDGAEFVYTGASSDIDAQRVDQICVALGLNKRQFKMFADRIRDQQVPKTPQQSIAANTLICSLSVVSAFYRLASLARALQMAPEDFCALIELQDNGTGNVWRHFAGQPRVSMPRRYFNFSSDFLTLLQGLSHVSQWLQKRQLSGRMAALLCKPKEFFVPSGSYGTASSDRVASLSMDWVDGYYDSERESYRFIQEISFQPSETLNFYPWTYALRDPRELALTGPPAWKAGTTGWCSINSNFGYQDPNLTIDPGPMVQAQTTTRYTIAIPVEILARNVNLAQRALPYDVSIAPSSDGNGHEASLQVFQSAVFDLNDGTVGTVYQFAFIQELWRELANTLVDSSLFRASGAPLVDDDGKPIDWMGLLSANTSKGPLIDAAGFITDNADQTRDITVDGKATPIILTIGNAVAAQKLNPDEAAQAMVALNAAVLQKRKAQTGVVISLLAKTLDISASLSALVLRWVQQTPYQWSNATWTLKSFVQSAGDIPANYLYSLQEIARRSLLCQHFSLSPAAVQYLLDHPAQFGLLPYDDMAYSGEVSFTTLYMLGRYEDLLEQVGTVGEGTEDDVLAYLRHVNTYAVPGPETERAAALLASLLGWDQEEVQACWTVLGGVARSIPQIDAVMRMQQNELAIGLTVNQQQQAFVLDRESGYVAWQEVGQAMVAGANHVKGGN